MKRSMIALTLVLIAALGLLSGCSLPGQPVRAGILQTTAVPQATVPAAAPVISADSLAALEGTLQSIYEQVNPSVVNIQVTQRATGVSLRGFQGWPDQQQQPPQQYQQGSGSGFVWDKQGHIVTNNHVIEGADKIRVTFYDGAIVPGEVVGADPDSDLAVVKVDLPADQLQPVQMADSTRIKVGSLAVAIGQPFGLENTMTVGFVSALGRSMPAGSDSSTSSAPSYTIPDVIQTDAPINPGNSGGVLLNSQGQVIGVTSAIISPVRASVGIGFAVPSAIVQKVVPVLIEKGSYKHAWLGLSGTTLVPEMATAMNLPANQRGALVGEVTSGGPSDKAGLKGSTKAITIDGDQIQVGGDVIVAIDGQTVKTFDDLVSYLARVQAGQKVTLGVLRDGKQSEVAVTLGERPGQQQASRTVERTGTGGAWLGITGVTLTAQVATAADLPQNQRGVLLQEVSDNSPASKAGLRGGTKSVTVNGQKIVVGGDLISAWDGNRLTSMQDLQTRLARAEAGQEVTLTILRDKQELPIKVTLAAPPTS